MLKYILRTNNHKSDCYIAGRLPNIWLCNKMKLAFKQKSIELEDPVILSTTDGDYSMPYVAGLIEWLEGNGAIVEDRSWETDSYGNLIENGIDVNFETVMFRFICSYDNFIIKRVSGNKAKFWGLCELFKETEC